MRHKKKVIALAVIVLTPILAHLYIDHAVRFVPPAVTTAELPHLGAERAGKGWTTTEAGVRIVSLAGSPEEIGAQHSALLYDRMSAVEATVFDGFQELLPVSPLRTLMFDFGRFRHRHVVDNFPDDRRHELAAQARGFQPDPFTKWMDTYTRMIFLSALYDIALGFEHSPLLGNAPGLGACSAFGLLPNQTSNGHPLFARAFDFEAAALFDTDKVVFFVREDGRIPFASVAWPGFIGVVTGMNAEGVAMAVMGARAKDPATTGMPVPFSIRDALGRAHDTKEAIAILSSQDVMVSHMVFVGDANGSFAIVERAPGEKAYAREGNAVTNHFEGPLSKDPRDAEVRKSSTTLPRRARLDEMLANVDNADAARAVAMLRDHGCAKGEACPPGDRRSIDAFIATHGIVADLQDRVLWVSAGPRLSGRFVKIDLASLVSHPDDVPHDPDTIPEDPALLDGRYQAGRARAGGPMLGPKQ